MSTMKIKKGDTVVVIAGKDKDKEGKVIYVGKAKNLKKRILYAKNGSLYQKFEGCRFHVRLFQDYNGYINCNAYPRKSLSLL